MLVGQHWPPLLGPQSGCNPVKKRQWYSEKLGLEMKQFVIQRFAYFFFFCSGGIFWNKCINWKFIHFHDCINNNDNDESNKSDDYYNDNDDDRNKRIYSNSPIEVKQFIVEFLRWGLLIIFFHWDLYPHHCSISSSLDVSRSYSIISSELYSTLIGGLFSFHFPRWVGISYPTIWKRCSVQGSKMTPADC